MKLGILHPGAMGAALAAAASVPTYWASEDRSSETRQRAVGAGMQDIGSIGGLVARVDVVVSVCPPHSAVEVATAVAAAGFGGVYLDANAVSPATATQIALMFPRFVDGGIIGPPPHQVGTTRLYLAGSEAAAVAEIWEGSALEARVLTGDIGSASALKMAYAGWTKGSTALLFAMRAYAEATGVGEELLAEWELSIPDLPTRLERSATRSGPKAWRFADEMGEIAESLGVSDIPAGFHEAAREVYRRLASLKGEDSPTVDELLSLLNRDAGEA